MYVIILWIIFKNRGVIVVNKRLIVNFFKNFMFLIVSLVKINVLTIYM